MSAVMEMPFNAAVTRRPPEGMERTVRCLVLPPASRRSHAPVNPAATAKKTSQTTKTTSMRRLEMPSTDFLGSTNGASYSECITGVGRAGWGRATGPRLTPRAAISEVSCGRVGGGGEVQVTGLLDQELLCAPWCAHPGVTPHHILPFRSTSWPLPLESECSRPSEKSQSTCRRARAKVLTAGWNARASLSLGLPAFRCRRQEAHP